MQDAICSYLNAQATTTLCTVCGKMCSLNHTLLRCAKELEVYAEEGTLKWWIGRRQRKVNTCVRTDCRHQHQEYEEAQKCYLQCKEAQGARRREIQNLLNERGNPCQKCGDVFADHTLANCVKHPYLTAGDNGF